MLNFYEFWQEAMLKSVTVLSISLLFSNNNINSKSKKCFKSEDSKDFTDLKIFQKIFFDAIASTQKKFKAYDENEFDDEELEAEYRRVYEYAIEREDKTAELKLKIEELEALNHALMVFAFLCQLLVLICLLLLKVTARYYRLVLLLTILSFINLINLFVINNVHYVYLLIMLVVYLLL